MPQNNFAGAIDQWLKNKGKRFTKVLGVSLLALVAALDLAVAGLLREAPALATRGGGNESAPSNGDDDSWWFDGRDPEDYDVSWRWDDLVRGLGDFTGDTVDICLIAVVRIVLLSALLWLGVYVGTPRLGDISDNNVSTIAPLLINSGQDSLHELASEAKSSHLQSYDRQKRAEVRRNVVIGLMFALSTAAQIYTGIKVIRFVGHWDDGDAPAATIRTLQAVFFFSSVFVINCEAFIANRLVSTLTVEEGFYVPEFHQHRLFFEKRVGHVCDLCHNGGENWYRCNVCDFDACPACFNKKDKATGEGVMRGDKGVRDMKVVGRFDYLMRGIRLIWPHLGLFLLALSCLLAQTAASLFLPRCVRPPSSSLVLPPTLPLPPRPPTPGGQSAPCRGRLPRAPTCPPLSPNPVPPPPPAGHSPGSLQGQLFDHIISANHVCRINGTDSDECHVHEAGFESVILT